MNAQKLAASWRKRNGYAGKGGVVVIYGREVQGWVNVLRDPQHWCPGCIAVTEDGIEYSAVGGNERDGAQMWKELH